MAQAETFRRWQERLRRFDQSQTTVAQFCADEGISQASYYHWKRKLRDPATQITPISIDDAARFVPVALQATPNSFREVPRTTTHSPRATATIDLPGGIRIHVEVPTEPYRDESNEQFAAEGY